jgi:hypothetical protein
VTEYKGRRDPRFVATHRGGTLNEATHRLLAAWAADCAEHVLPLFVAANPDDDRPARAIATARAWARGEATVLEAREAAYAAHASARENTDPAAREVARAAGHAVATAHMADHELGGAYFAIRAVRAASAPGEAVEQGKHECRWQRDRLPEEIRELVLSDMRMRAKKFGTIFDC